MTIDVGHKLPSISLKAVINGEMNELNLAEFTADKKIVLFAVPGAFTPGCSNTHLPGFVANQAQLKAKGVDAVICTSVNDIFVMQAWGQQQEVGEIIMLADGNAELAQALGLSMDASAWAMGQRSSRYAMITEQGEVSFLAVDAKGIELSAAENVLAQL